MKVYEIVNYALNLLGEDVVLTGESILDGKTKTILKCVNIALDEIAQDYISPRKKEHITVLSGTVKYSSLSERVLDIISVKKDGRKITFNMNTSDLSVDGEGSMKIVYTYLPKAKELNDDIQLSPKITVKTLALGACAEYALIEGNYEQSVTFNDRFKNDLKCACRRDRLKNLTVNRWF